MLARVLLVWCVFAVSSAVTAATVEDVLPLSKLRPKNASHFHPGLVKLTQDDVREAVLLIGNDLGVGRDAEWLRNQTLDTSQLIRLLGASSPAVREWALRTMGEDRCTHPEARLPLLAIATDGAAKDFPRALAARVLARQGIDATAAAGLASQLEEVSDSLRIIFLETIKSAGPAGTGCVPQLVACLESRDAATQFQAFEALRQFEISMRRDFAEVAGMNYRQARNLVQLREKSAVAAARQSVAILQTQPEGYVICVALLGLLNQSQSGAAEAIISVIGHEDPFIAELAGNVMDSLSRLTAADILKVAAGAASTNDYVRLRCLTRLRELGGRALPAMNSVFNVLAGAVTNGASAREVGICLNIVSSFGTNAAIASPLLVRLLEEDSPIYRNLLKHEVHRLRGFIFAALAQTGVPDEAFPPIISALSSANALAAYEFAGAARAAASAGPRARSLTNHLLRGLEASMAEDLVSFGKFESHAAERDVTTAQIEALRALRRIGIGDEGVFRAVEEFVTGCKSSSAVGLVQPVLKTRDEAERTLDAISTHRAGLARHKWPR